MVKRHKQKAFKRSGFTRKEKEGQMENNQQTSFYDHIKTIDFDNAPVGDKLWRIQNLYPIQNKAGETVRLKLNKHQLEIVKRIKKNGIDKPLIMLKSRQVGITTLFVIWFLDDCLTYSGISAAIQSHKHESMKDIFRIARLAYDQMHPAYKPAETDKGSTQNRTEIAIGSLHSRIEVKLEVRSTSVNRVHFSEYAFIDPDRLAATEGSLATKCFKVYESTPNGLNHFHDLYQRHRALKNTFFIPWHHHDEFKMKLETKELPEKTPEEQIMQLDYKLSDEQLMYRRTKLETMPLFQFAQEFPVNDLECFHMSGKILIDRSLLFKRLKYAENRNAKDHIVKDKLGNEKLVKGHLIRGNLKVRIYRLLTEEEIASGNFVCFLGVDSAEGIGQDYSAGVVLIAKEGSHVLEHGMTIHGYESPSDFAKSIHSLMNEFYNHDDVLPHAVIERNNHGHAILSILSSTEEFNYNNLYVYKDARHGFLTTAVSKKNLLNDFFTAIREDDIKIRDQVIIQELFTMILTDAGKFEAEQGKHDDLVIATALAFHGYHNRNRFFTEEVQIEEVTL